MIYNGKLFNNNGENYYEKLSNLLDIKKLLIYALIALLLSRINILFYIAPIGIAFTATIMFKNNKVLTVLVGIFSILGYFSIRSNFDSFDLYIIINMILIFLGIFFNIKKKHRLFILLLICLISYIYKYFYVRFSIYPTLFSITIEVGIIYVLYYVFDIFIKSISYFNTNYIFKKEDIICLVITTCLILCGINGFKIFNLDLSNILIVLFVFMMSYINGMSVGVICAVFSGSIMGFIYGNFTEYIAIYSVIATVSSFLSLSSRFTVSVISIVCVLILKLSNMSSMDIGSNLFLIEIFIGSVIFDVVPKSYLMKITMYFNEEYKKEFYTNKRLFNTLDMRIQKINEFNDIIKELSDMIVSNVNFKYKILDKKIYIEILAESVCGECSNVNKCWKVNFNKVRTEMLLSLDNFIQGDKSLTEYIDSLCIRKDKFKNELYKISNFYNIQKVYEERIYEAQDMLSYELKNLHNIINQSIKEVKKDIVIKVNYEKSLISKFNKFNIKYFDIICYEESERLKVKIILPYNIFIEYKNDLLDIINIALDREMIIQDEPSKYINSNDEIIVTYVEKYCYNVVSHCLQLSKKDKNGDSYICTNSINDDYLIILSDGIGSGIEAYNKSKFTVDLIYKFVRTSLSLSSCIKEIISIISLKFFRDEAISTIDFARIDLYTGKMNYLKFSSIITYIKRNNEVFILGNERDLNDNSLDDDIRILSSEFDLECGDILVHLTDGLIHFKDLSNKAWLYTFLKRCDVSSPDKLCEEILREFKILNSGSFQDDVSVIVSKVYKN